MVQRYILISILRNVVNFWVLTITILVTYIVQYSTKNVFFACNEMQGNAYALSRKNYIWSITPTGKEVWNVRDSQVRCATEMLIGDKIELNYAPVSFVCVKNVWSIYI